MTGRAKAAGASHLPATVGHESRRAGRYLQHRALAMSGRRGTGGTRWGERGERAAERRHGPAGAGRRRGRAADVVAGGVDAAAPPAPAAAPAAGGVRAVPAAVGPAPVPVSPAALSSAAVPPAAVSPAGVRAAGVRAALRAAGLPVRPAAVRPAALPVRPTASGVPLRLRVPRAVRAALGAAVPGRAAAAGTPGRDARRGDPAARRRRDVRQLARAAEPAARDRPARRRRQRRARRGPPAARVPRRPLPDARLRGGRRAAGYAPAGPVEHRLRVPGRPAGLLGHRASRSRGRRADRSMWR